MNNDKLKAKIVLDYIKDNIDKSNASIARIIKNNNVKEFKDSELDSLRRYVSKIRNINKISNPNVLNKSDGGVVVVKGTDITIDKTEYLNAERTLNKVKSELSAKDKKIKLLLSELESVEEKIGIYDAVSDYKPNTYIITPTKGIKSEATAVWVNSDAHIEELVEKEMVNGINEYNIDIAKSSMNNFFVNGLKMTDIQSSGVEIRNVVIALLGDCISGYIHPELEQNNQLSPIEAIMMVTDWYISGLKYVLSNSEYSYKVVCKYGNHARNTDKTRVSTGYKNNYEWLLYTQLSKYFENESRIEFIIEKSYHTYMDIYDYIIRFHHGDFLTYKGGIGGITIPVNKAISQWNKLYPKPVYLDVFGHWHQFFDGGNFICNGSIIGYNAYALSIKASFDVPKQAFFLIDKERGKTIVAPIFVRK